MATVTEDTSEASLLDAALVAALVDTKGNIDRATDLLLRRFPADPVILALAGPQIRSAAQRQLIQVQRAILTGTCAVSSTIAAA